MAINQAVGDIIAVTLNGLWHVQRVQSTLTYRVTSVVGAPTTSGFATALDTAFNAANKLYQRWRECCPSNYTLNYVDIQTIRPTRVVRDTFSKLLGGLSGQASSTANIAAVISKRGSLANRHNMGSIHVPYTNLDVGMHDGIVGNAMQASLLNLSLEVVGPYAVGALGNVVPVIWGPKTPTVSYDITSAFGQQTVRVMRRRTVGVGK